jgi:hypothetical protein
LGLLLKTVQEDHRRAIQTEQDAIEVALQSGPHLEEAITKAINERLAHGLLPLNELNV